MAEDENDRRRELRLQIRLSEIESNNELRSALLTSAIFAAMVITIELLMTIEFNSDFPKLTTFQWVLLGGLIFLYVYGVWCYIEHSRRLRGIFHELRVEYGLNEEIEDGGNLDQNRAIRQRTVDILIGALFGLILGVVSNIWVEVFDKLFLVSLSGQGLIGYFILSTILMCAAGYVLWRHAIRLENR